MQILENVYRVPNLLSRVIGFRAFAFGSKIFLRNDVYDYLISNNPDPQSLAVIAHEQVHIKRAKKYGLFKFGIKYWLNKEFRFQEELAATKAQFEVLKRYGVGNGEVEKRAKHLSPFRYLWCVSYDEALKELSKAWDRV